MNNYFNSCISIIYDGPRYMPLIYHCFERNYKPRKTYIDWNKNKAL